jgi:hypothetical protein
MDLNRSSCSRSKVGKMRYASCVLGASILLASCADSTARSAGQAAPSPVRSQVATSTSISSPNASPEVTASPVDDPQPAFADNSGGTLYPLPPDAVLSMSAEQVRESLLGDGASRDWLTDPGSLVVRAGVYVALTTDAKGATSTASPSADGSASGSPATGVDSYVFSGGTAACPPAVGGTGTTASENPSPTICAATIVADASTGQIEDEEISPA